jgi:hypothetical protein
METVQKTLPINFHPQQNEFIFDSLTFNSKFDSGNLERVEKIDDDNV